MPSTNMPRDYSALGSLNRVLTSLQAEIKFEEDEATSYEKYAANARARLAELHERQLDLLLAIQKLEG